MAFSPRAFHEEVAYAKQQFAKAGREAEWNGLLKSYLEENFEAAGREFATTGGLKTQAPNFRRMMLGNPRQAKNLRAAMSGKQWDAFSGLLDVFEAMGRVPMRGSDTTWNQEFVRELRNESGGALKNLLEPWSIPGRLRDWVQEVRLGNHAETLARTITSPDAMTKLKQLRQVNPRSARATAIAISALPLGGSNLLNLGPGEHRSPEELAQGLSSGAGSPPGPQARR